MKLATKFFTFLSAGFLIPLAVFVATHPSLPTESAPLVTAIFGITVTLIAVALFWKEGKYILKIVFGKED